MDPNQGYFDKLEQVVATPQNMATLDQAQAVFNEVLEHTIQGQRAQEAGDFLEFVSEGVKVAEILAPLDRDTIMTVALGAITVIARESLGGE